MKKDWGMTGGSVAGIRNSQELQSILEKAAKEVIEEVSDEVLRMVRNQIMKDVYGKDGNDWYLGGTKTPTFEFLNAWEKSSLKTSIKEITQEIFYNSSKVDYIGSLWKHGNPGRSAKDELAAILNLEYMGNDPEDPNSFIPGFTSGLMMGNRHFSSKNKRDPYWQNLLKELFGRKKLEKMITKSLKIKFGNKITVTGSFS